MANDSDSRKKAPEKDGNELWAEPVGVRGAMVLMCYLASMALILIAGAVWLLWKVCTRPEGGGSCVWLILLVIVLAALGAQIRCVKSVWWYVGNRKLKKSWVPMYLLSPLVGSMLGFVFYLLVRGGLVALGGQMETPSEVALAGASALVGMFSDEASMKFKALAQAIFSSAEKGRDSEPEKDAKRQT